MQLQNFPFFCFLFIVGLLSCAGDQTIEEKTKPNVILILTDDQGWGDLSINGNPNIKTPNVKALANNGVTFKYFFVSPVCSPTRAEILTGRFNPRCGVYSTSAGGERLDLDETTIAQLFQNRGYNTAAFGKWHNGMQYPYHPNGRGFDEYYGFCSGHWGHYFSPMLEHNGQIVKGEGFLPDDLTNRAMSFIESKKDEPFFVYLPYNTPHSPMQVPEEWWNKYKDIKLQGSHYKSDEEVDTHTKSALAMCANIDWNIGRLTAHLDKLELTENTIILFLSDNGPNGWRWNGGMRGRKGSTDEGGVRSPLIMQWKGKLSPNIKVNQIASAIDLMPTLLDLCDIPMHTNKPVDGKSLAPLILKENPEWENRIVYNFFRGSLSVRNQQFRLDDADRLYNMTEDYGQTNDVSEQNPEVKEELVEAKKWYRNEVITELPENDTRTFPIGHKEYLYTQIPARDGIAHGNINRSNRWPNCSFFTNWTSLRDSITWKAEVMEDGDYEVILYYTCPEESVGATVALTFNKSQIVTRITEAHDPPLIGMAEDRDPRIESYVKDFEPMKMGILSLKKGNGTLSLKALDIPGKEVMDFRLLMFNRVSST